MESIRLDQGQRQTQSLKQLQRLMNSPQMKQAINMLQVPLMELQELVELEMEQNPVLEYSEDKAEEQDSQPEQEMPAEQELSFDDNDFEILKKLDEDFRDHFAESENYYTKRTQDEEKLKSFLEQSIPTHVSLAEHLHVQARETFDADVERQMAKEIIGYLDESGLLTTELSEIALLNNFSEQELEEVLLEIQTFEPPGVAARSLQECLLIQLRRLKLKNSLAYKIIEKHFDNLLHNRIPVISKSLKCTPEQVRAEIDHHIAPLDLHPGTLYFDPVVQNIIPDVTLNYEEDEAIIEINKEYIPSFRLNKRYMRMLEDDSLKKEDKEYIKNKIMSAKWLMKNIDQRNDTVYRIVETLAKWQKEFFINPTGKLTPLTMKVLAEELELHESTIARAVSNKYVNSPRGILPLRSFFSVCYTTDAGDDISSNTVRDTLKKIIDEENKQKPLSDEAISKKLKEKGVPCARRTVAKYRVQLNIGNTNQRREYC